jgi:glycosyltransferase involved in cell wall biosynthesis
MPNYKILQLCKKFPYPIKDGEVIGIINLTIGFHQLSYSTTVLALNTLKHFFDPAKLPAEISNIARFEAVAIDTTVRPLPALLNLFSTKSYNVERFYSKVYEQKLYQQIVDNHYDVILLEGIYLMRYIDIIRRAIKDSNRHPIVVQRPQNVEYIIWERLARHEDNWFKKMYLSFLAKRMQRFETAMINEADVLIPVSQTDLDIFKFNGLRIPSMAIPTGYVFDAILPVDYGIEQNAVAFLGGMDWMPNREGVDWFLEKVWPIVLKQKPDAVFYLAGRNIPSHFFDLKIAGLKVVGEVDDAQKYINSYAISIVPLFAGSGMRVKIIEAMALGRAIVSTSVGAESIRYTNHQDIMIADDAVDFAAAILTILKEPAHRRTLGENAQKLIADKYDNRKISHAIIDFAINQKSKR